MPRLPGESLLEWRARLVGALDEAREAAAPEEARLMAAMEVGPGQPFPTVDQFDFTAQERVEVLEHQLAGRPFNRIDDLY